MLLSYFRNMSLFGEGGVKKGEKEKQNSSNSQIKVTLDKFDLTETLAPRIRDVCIWRKKNSFRLKGQCKVPLLKLAQ